MASKWYYQLKGHEFGPVTTQQLKSLAESKRIAPSDLIWKDGMSAWQYAGRLPGLFIAAVADRTTSFRSNDSILPAAADDPPPAAQPETIEQTESFAARLLAATQFVAKHAVRAQLLSIRLPNAFKDLGKYLEKHALHRAEFPALYHKISQLKLAKATPADCTGERPVSSGIKAKAQAAALAGTAIAKNKAIDFRINRKLRQLGEITFLNHGEQCGPSEIIARISHLKTQIGMLEEEIADLSKPPRLVYFSPPRILFAATACFLLAIALAIILHSHVKKPVGIAPVHQTAVAVKSEISPLTVDTKPKFFSSEQGVTAPIASSTPHKYLVDDFNLANRMGLALRIDVLCGGLDTASEAGRYVAGIREARYTGNSNWAEAGPSPVHPECPADGSEIISESARDGKIHLVTTQKIELQDSLYMAYTAFWITDPTAPSDARGHMLGAIYVYNFGERGKLSRYMPLHVAYGQLEISCGTPRLTVEDNQAADGVVETLEYADLNPYLHSLILEEVPTVEVRLGGSLQCQLPERSVQQLRGFNREAINCMKLYDQPIQAHP